MVSSFSLRSGKGNRTPGKAKRHQTNRPLQFEPLESKVLMAADLNSGTGLLTWTGTEGNDVANIYTENGQIVVHANGGVQGRFNPEAVKKVMARGLGGDDRITLLVNGEIADLQGGAGNDVLTVGAGNTTGSWLYGGSGNDQLNGGAGRDLLFGQLGDDVLNGGAGNDEIRGEDGNDVLHGNAGNDVIFGGHGNDRIFGEEGNDWLYGETGVDLLVGGIGTNTYAGGAGADVIRSHQGWNRIKQEFDGNILEGGGKTNLTPRSEINNDRTNSVYFTGDTVKFQRKTFPGVQGTFYSAWTENVSRGDFRGKIGPIDVFVSEYAGFQIDADLRAELGTSLSVFLVRVGSST
jgi:Ca2+-binding RTX toxin-like protein